MTLRVLVAALVGLVPTVQSQQPTIVTGRITDSSNTVVPGVAVVFRAIAIAPPVVLVTDEAGRFRASVRASDTYRVIATLAGFKPVIRDELKVADATELNLTFELAGSCECRESPASRLGQWIDWPCDRPRRQPASVCVDHSSSGRRPRR